MAAKKNSECCKQGRRENKGSKNRRSHDSGNKRRSYSRGDEDVEDEEEEENYPEASRPPPPRRSRAAANWETRFGSGAAVSLTVLEVKRLLLLTIEILVNSRAIRFSGAMIPVLMSFVDVALGFPIAIAAVHAFRKQHNRNQQSNIKKGNASLGRLAVILVLCVILNAITLVLIGLQVNLEPKAMHELFTASMNLYSSNATDKVALDELQMDLQCCGFSGYDDWFGVNWQGTSSNYGDYDDYESMMQDKSVPFSCCCRQTLFPCAHSHMRKGDENTVNTRGCAPILHNILVKISIVGYIMTGVILATQILVVIFLIRVVKKGAPNDKDTESVCSCYEPSFPLISHGYSSDEGCDPDCPGRSRLAAVETDEAYDPSPPPSHHQQHKPPTMSHNDAALRRAENRLSKLFYEHDPAKLRALLSQSEVPRRPEIPYSGGEAGSEAESQCSFGTTWNSEPVVSSSPGAPSTPSPPPPAKPQPPVADPSRRLKPKAP